MSCAGRSVMILSRVLYLGGVTLLAVSDELARPVRRAHTLATFHETRTPLRRSLDALQISLTSVRRHGPLPERQRSHGRLNRTLERSLAMSRLKQLTLSLLCGVALLINASLSHAAEPKDAKAKVVGTYCCMRYNNTNELAARICLKDQKPSAPWECFFVEACDQCPLFPSSPK